MTYLNTTTMQTENDFELPEPTESILFRLKGRPKENFIELVRPKKRSGIGDPDAEMKVLGMDMKSIKSRREPEPIKIWGKKLF